MEDYMEDVYFVCGDCALDDCDDCCYDEIELVVPVKNNGRRRTGRRYRRRMTAKHNDDLMAIIMLGKYNPNAGYVEFGLVDGVLQPVGNHIKYVGHSRRKKFYKRYSNKLIRNSKCSYLGGQYKKEFDMDWNVL